MNDEDIFLPLFPYNHDFEDNSLRSDGKISLDKITSSHMRCLDGKSKSKFYLKFN